MLQIRYFLTRHTGRAFIVTMLALGLLVLVACGPAEGGGATAVPELGDNTGDAPPTETAVTPPEEYPGPDADAQDAYPPAQTDAPAAPSDDAQGAYPPPTPPLPTATPLPENYPAPTEETFLEPRFQFDLPLTTGATQVTGQAPPDLPLAIVDVTLNGTVLGTGQSDGNGRFSIDVQPLPDGHRIGVTFAELEPGLDFPQMSEKYFPYRGDSFMNIPNVGIFLETALVES